MLVNPLIAPALLGATISNTLCWDAHMYHSIKKCNSYLFLLSRLNVFLSRRNRILFYNSYILPHLDFCCVINQNKIAGSLFLDFSKAFDLVDHSLLIHKLRLLNIDTSWFSSCLNKRF